MKYYIDRITNEVFAFEEDGSQDEFIKKGLEFIPETEVPTALEQQESVRLSILNYAEKRLEAYNALNQLELISDDSINGTTTHKDAILAIKAEFPKP